MRWWTGAGELVSKGTGAGVKGAVSGDQRMGRAGVKGTGSGVKKAGIKLPGGGRGGDQRGGKRCSAPFGKNNVYGPGIFDKLLKFLKINSA